MAGGFYLRFLVFLVDDAVPLAARHANRVKF